MTQDTKTSVIARQLVAATAQSRPREYYANDPGKLAPWYRRLWHQKMTLRKAALYVAIVVLMALSSPILPTFVAGTLLVAAGIALRIWTFGHLVKNEHMTTTGPYGYTRNPAYLGSFIIFCGFALAAGNPFSVGGWLAWAMGLVMSVVFIRFYLPRKYAREYPRLEQMFPQAFKQHAAHVPNFLPRLTPWRSGDTRTFSWTCVSANHELCWAPILALGLALLWLG